MKPVCYEYSSKPQRGTQSGPHGLLAPDLLGGRQLNQAEFSLI